MNKPNNWLSACARDESIPTYTSQRGEDRILQKLFEALGTQSKWCVEFGATDGKAKSNTWYWINKQNWHSVQIEAARDSNLGLRNRERWSFDALAERYRHNDRVTCLNRWIETAGPNSLDAILKETPLPRQFDLLSVDVDGPDYAIWDSLKNYTPRVVVIEHNKTIPIETVFHSDRGSSLRALTLLGKKKGYELVAANDLNAIFVTAAEYPKVEIAHNSPEELWAGHEAFRLTATQHHDTITLHGTNKLRWVRGFDGTLTSQLQAGHMMQVNEGQTTIPSTNQAGLKAYTSGILRHVYYSLTAKK